MASRGPTITHLFFADDSLIFFKADPYSCSHVKEAITTYETASGKMVNIDKSAISFSPNTSSSNQCRVKQILGVRESRGHELYLGAPSFSLRRRRIQFGYLRDNITKKVENWANKKFSKGGREVLIKAVLQAVPTFAMSCFRIPTTVCKELEIMCAKFWWGSSSSKRGIHWKSWESLCRNKDEGGLGFREMGSFNRALLAKQIWRMSSKPDSLVTEVFKSRYFRNLDIMQAPLGSNPSFVWRSLCWGRELIRMGTRWRVSDGKAIPASERNWFGSWAPSSTSTCRRQNQWVGNYISTSENWIEDKVREDFLPFEAEEILATNIEHNGGGDTRYWSTDPKGEYTVRSGYKLWYEHLANHKNWDIASGSGKNDKGWSKIWSAKIPPKIKIFWWSLSWNIIPTEANLARMHVPLSPSCSFCGFVEADTLHALFECPLVKYVWKEKGCILPKGRVMGANAADLLAQLSTHNSSWDLEKLVTLAWAIWKKRCEFSHKESQVKGKFRRMGSKDIDWALTMVEEYQRMGTKERSGSKDSSWQDILKRAKEKGKCLLVISDGSFHQNENKAAAGVLLINEEGNLVKWDSAQLYNCQSPLEAELGAVLLGVNGALDLGVNNIMMITDCLEAVYLLKERESISSRGGYTLELIRERLSHFNLWEVQHIERSKIEVAHEIAKYVWSPTDSQDWVSSRVNLFVRDLKSL